jgi:hypothetical protein
MQRFARVQWKRFSSVGKLMSGMELARKMLADPDMLNMLNDFQQILQRKGIAVEQLRKLPHQQVQEMIHNDLEFKDYAIKLQNKLASLDISPRDMVELSKTFGTPLPPGFEEYANKQQQ